jgi:hypothetical protein
MELTGQLGPDDKVFYDQCVSPVSDKLAAEMKAMPGGPVKEAAIRLQNDLTAIASTLMNLCAHPRTSSQAVCALLRTLLEACISVFAFCGNPAARASLYLDFAAVLDWRNVCIDEKHIDNPLSPDTAEKRSRLAERKANAKRNVERLGLPYVMQAKNKTGEERLLQAIEPGNETKKFFRETWYPDGRVCVLEAEKMGWVYDVLYRRLCSAVHSDAGASKVLAGIKREHMVTIAWQWWAAAIYRLVEALKLRLPEEQNGFLLDCYQGLLQVRPEEPTSPGNPSTCPRAGDLPGRVVGAKPEGE